MAEMFNTAEGYEKMMGRFSSVLAPLLADFAQVGDVGKILDVGCGTGSLTQAIATRTHEADIVGIDPSPAFIQSSRTRFIRNRRITLDVGSALELPYPDKTFTQCLACLVIQFISDPKKAVSEMTRVTKPNGTVTACTWDSRGMKMGAVFFEEALRLNPSAESRLPRTKYLNEPGQLSDLWKAVGLKDVVETAMEIQMEYDSFDDYWVPVSTGGGPNTVYASALAPEDREELRKALRKRFLGDRPDGPFSLPAKSLAVRGTVP